MIWAEKIPIQYVRSDSDGKKKCPICQAQWNWSLKRDLDYYKSHAVRITCNKCHQTFVWIGGHI